MLFRKDTLDAIARGDVTLAFRRWTKPTVGVGGTLRTRAGVLAFEAVEPIALAKITDADAKKAGEASRLALLKRLAKPGRAMWGGGVRKTPAGRLYRIRFHVAGDDPRVALRAKGRVGASDRAVIDAKLARLDRASTHGAWTATVLALVAKRPAVRAPDLAASLGLATVVFKRDVRKLKELGLTESLAVGYRLSPRGRAYLRKMV